MSRARKGGSWIRARRRWSLYLRDGLRCVYCLRTLEDVLADGCFMTLDHVKHDGPNHEANIVSACFDCNGLKGRKTLVRFAADLGVPASTIRTRLAVRRSKDRALYVEAAGLLLGMVDGVPRAAIVTSNDWLARYQFREDDPEFEYLNDLAQGSICGECGRPHAEPLPF